MRMSYGREEQWDIQKQFDAFGKYIEIPGYQAN